MSSNDSLMLIISDHGFHIVKCSFYLWAFKLPWNICHDINRISSTDSDTQSSQATAIRCVTVRTDHQ